jgi:hypothetical protein
LLQTARIVAGSKFVLRASAEQLLREKRWDTIEVWRSCPLPASLELVIVDGSIANIGIDFSIKEA